jgi:hypothetical protein
MFETDAKKLLKSKYNKIAGIGAATGKKFKTHQAQAFDGNSVYDELKLSEKLSYELNLIRNKVDNLKEQLEESLYQRSLL